MKTRKKLFVTGGAGKVAAGLRRHLKDCCDFRLLFHRSIPEVAEGEEVVVSDLTDFPAMLEAGSGVDAIVHLGIAGGARGWPRSRRDQETMEVNVRGTYNIFESARINRVPTVVFASTNHVTGRYEAEGVFTTPDMPVRPDSLYGVSKAFGEALGRHYHEAYGMSVYCLRIGNYPDTSEVNREYEPGMNRWLSDRDSAELVCCCLEAPHPQFGIFYAVSKGAEKKWDLASARELVGWKPQDRGAESP